MHCKLKPPLKRGRKGEDKWDRRGRKGNKMRGVGKEGGKERRKDHTIANCFPSLFPTSYLFPLSYPPRRVNRDHVAV